MDFSEVFDRVVEMARDADTLDDAWVKLSTYLHDSLQAPERTSFASVPIRRDVTQVRSALERLLRDEPPPQSIDAFYFGLFDAVDDAGNETMGYYVAGVTGFDAEDGDSLCDPAWWPEGRYLESLALSTIRTDQLKARSSKRSRDAELLGYAGQLGVALVVSKFAATGLLGGRKCVVGFDSGDFAIL